MILIDEDLELATQTNFENEKNARVRGEIVGKNPSLATKENLKREKNWRVHVLIEKLLSSNTQKLVKENG